MDKHKIRSAISYIENHSNECISVAQLAEITGYNEDYFAESFREHTGLSVAAYIRRYKITLAAFDLLAGLSSGEVAAKYGFETASGFAKAFRKCYDMSPREYKATYEWDPTPSFQFFPDLQVIAHILLPPDSSFTLSERILTTTIRRNGPKSKLPALAISARGCTRKMGFSMLSVLL